MPFASSITAHLHWIVVGGIAILCLLIFYVTMPSAKRKGFFITIVGCLLFLIVINHFVGPLLWHPVASAEHPSTVIHQRVVVHHSLAAVKPVPTKSASVRKNGAHVVPTIAAKTNGGSSSLDMLLKFLLLFGGCIVVILLIVLVSYWSQVEAQRKRRAGKEQLKW